jgi:hypothetical protein
VPDLLVLSGTDRNMKNIPILSDWDRGKSKLDLDPPVSL